MIITTTPSIEGRTITSYKGIVIGEVIIFTNSLTRNMDVAQLRESREKAFQQMEQNANKLGANSIVGVDINYDTFSPGNNIMIISVSGTAVVVE